MLFLRVTVVVLMSATFACGESDNHRPPLLSWGPASTQLYTPGDDDVGGVVGHWFPCSDAVCSDFGIRGYGFEENGRVTSLEYRYEDGGADYCERYQQDSYRYEDGELTYISDSQIFGSHYVGTFQFIVDGAEAWVDEKWFQTFSTGYDLRFRRVPRASIGFCKCVAVISIEENGGVDPCADERPPAPR